MCERGFLGAFSLIDSIILPLAYYREMESAGFATESYILVSSYQWPFVATSLWAQASAVDFFPALSACSVKTSRL